MLKSVRMLPLLAALLTGCPPAFELTDGMSQPDGSVTPDGGKPAYIVVNSATCLPAENILGGVAGTPQPKLVAPASGGGLMELSPSENCAGKNTGTLMQMLCTIPAAKVASIVSMGAGFRIEVNGKTALPSVPTLPVSASGSIEVGNPSAISITTPVTGSMQAAAMEDAPWKASAVSGPIDLKGSDLQVLFKILITCGGSVTLPTPFHWQVDSLTFTSM